MLYLKTFFFLVLTLFFIPTNESLLSSSNDKENAPVKNIAGQDIDLVKLNSFLDQKMQEWKIPGLSMAIINNNEVAYHLVKGYADKEALIPVTEKTIFW